MKTHKVKQGEDVYSIAHQYGLQPEAILNYSKNFELKKKRGNFNVLKPGDEIIIPSFEFKEEMVEAGHRYRFRRKRIDTQIQFQFFDDDEKPRIKVPYKMKIVTTSGADIPEINGYTDRRGVITQNVPPDIEQGVIILNHEDDPEVIPFIPGNLDPVDEGFSGVKARLTNLGYECGDPEEETLDYITREAIRAFQEDNGLKLLPYDSDEISKDTIKKLKELYSV